MDIQGTIGRAASIMGGEFGRAGSVMQGRAASVIGGDGALHSGPATIHNLKGATWAGLGLGLSVGTVNAAFARGGANAGAGGFGRAGSVMGGQTYKGATGGLDELAAQQQAGARFLNQCSPSPLITLLTCSLLSLRCRRRGPCW